MATEITLDQQTLLQIAKDPRYVALLPGLSLITDQLKSTQVKKKKCGSCGGASSRQTGTVTTSTFDQVKRGIANLAMGSPEVARQFKELLGVTSVRVKYPKADGTAVIVKKF